MLIQHLKVFNPSNPVKSVVELVIMGFFFLVFQAMKAEILDKIESSYQLMCEERDELAPFALVVDGRALEIALRSDVKDQFLRLAVNCASVLCCRVSPKQKALVNP